MNVVFISGADVPNGIDGGTTLIRTYSRGFMKLGHTATIITLRCREEGVPAEGEIDGVKYQYNIRALQTKKFSKLSKIVRCLSWRVHLMRSIAANNRLRKIDLIIMYETSLDYGLPASVVARLLGVRLAYMYGDWVDYFGNSDRVRKLTLLRRISEALGPILLPHVVDVNLVLSNFLRTVLLRRGIKENRIMLLQSIVDCDKFRPDVPRHQGLVDLKNGRKLVLYLGSFLPHQGIHYLIEAATYLKSTGSDLLVVIVGDHDHELGRACRDKIKSSNLECSVIMYGGVSFDEVPSVLATADVLVTPRDDSKEGISAGPMKIAEYLASGTPVVATCVGDIAEMAQDGQEVLFCRARDPKSIADAVLKLSTDRDLYDTLSYHGRRLAEAQYDNGIVCARIAEFVKKLTVGR